MATIIKIEGVSLSETDRRRYVVQTARQAFNLSGRAKMALAACLHEIREGEYWRDYDESFDGFVYTEFGYKPSTADTLIRIYHTFVEHLERDPETIADIPWARLAMILPQISKENADDLLDKARSAATQSELMKYLKGLKGLHITENTDAAGARFSFTVGEDQKQIITEALEISEQMCGDNTYPGQIYELIFADFILSNQDGADHLEKSIQHLQRIHNVTITYTRNTQYNS